MNVCSTGGGQDSRLDGAGQVSGGCQDSGLDYSLQHSKVFLFQVSFKKLFIMYIVNYVRLEQGIKESRCYAFA